LRRLLVIAVCLVPLAAAGCGSSSSSSSGKDPLDNALGYMPGSAPVVFTLDTNLNDAQWQSLTANAKKFPFAGQIESSLKSSISQSGLNYDKDIKPLLGNPLVFSVPTVQTALASNSQVVGAMEVKDKSKLGKLLSTGQDLHKDGNVSGATLYKSSSDNTEIAQDGNVLVIANDRQQVVAALQQRDRSDRLTEDQFNSSLSGLPSDAIFRVYVNAQSLLNGSPTSATARKVKWVGALQTVGLTASSQKDGIAVDFNAKTDSSQLSDSDLPIASGDASPPVVVRPGQIAGGIRGLDQTERWAESVAAVVNPSGYANFVKSKRTLSSKLGLNIDKDIIAQLSGNSSWTVDGSGNYAFRASPKNPPAFQRTLTRFARVAPQFASGAGLKGARLTRAGSLYKLTGSSGKTIYYGMVGNVFAASNNAARLAQIASGAPQPVPGAKGAVAINADIGKLVAAAISKAAGGGLSGAFGGSLVTAPLGALTGWASSSTSGVTGHFMLQIK
jgi:uncharacterized protein DUF3352